MSRTILITGAGSGFGEGTAIGLAKQGHTVIAAAQSWPQVTALRNKAESLGLSGLRVEKLDLLEPHDTARVLDWEFDVLVNNAGIGRRRPHQRNPAGPGAAEFRGQRLCTTRLDPARGEALGQVEDPGQDRLSVVGPRLDESADGRRVFGHEACRTSDR